MKFRTALILSAVAHIALIVLVVLNFEFSKLEIKQSGSPKPQIKARAVSSKRVEQLVNKIKQEKLTKKQNEQRRLDELKKAEELAKRKRKQEEKKAEEATNRRNKAERKRKEEEKKAADLKKKRISDEKARKKKETADKKKKAEAEKKRKAEEVRKRKAKEEADRKKKAAEEKQRQEALEREMQAQFEAEAAELDAAHKQQVLTEADKFKSLIENKINRNWFKPEQAGFCILRIKIASSGIVFNIEVMEGDTIHCDSGRRAVRRAEPLPMSKDPDVYEVLKVLTFRLRKEPNEESP